MRLAVLLLACLPAHGGHWYSSARFWSTTALIAAEALDTGTSFAGQETNPWLASDGKLRAKGVALKWSAVGGFLVVEHFAVRRDARLSDFFTAAKCGLAGGTAGVSYTNWRKTR